MPSTEIYSILRGLTVVKLKKSVDIHIHWNGIDEMFMSSSGVGYVLEKERESVYVCARLGVLISFIYSSAGRSADASERERKDGSERQNCEIKCEEEREIQKCIHLSIHPKC